METNIVAETPELKIIEWSGPTGHGQVRLEYNGKGGYEVDAEYIGMDTLIEILANINKNKVAG